MKITPSLTSCLLLAACIAAPAFADITLRDFGPKTFDYTYGTSWKKGKTVTAGRDSGVGYVEIDAGQDGGGGLVLKGIDLSPNGEKFLAVTARLIEGNEANKLQFNFIAQGVKSKVSVKLDRFNTEVFETVYVPLPGGDFSAIENFQVQGINFNDATTPLKVQIDKLVVVAKEPEAEPDEPQTTGVDGTEWEAVGDQPAKDETARNPGKIRPWKPAHRPYPKYPTVWMQQHQRLFE